MRKTGSFCFTPIFLLASFSRFPNGSSHGVLCTNAREMVSTLIQRQYPRFRPLHGSLQPLTIGSLWRYQTYIVSFPKPVFTYFFTTKRLWIYIALIGVDTFATRNSFLRSCGESEECLLQTAMVIVDWSWHLPG